MTEETTPEQAHAKWMAAQAALDEFELHGPKPTPYMRLWDAAHDARNELLAAEVAASWAETIPDTL